VDLKRKAYKAFTWSGISVGLSIVFQIIQLYFVGTYLTTNDFGIWGILTVLLLFIKLFSDSGISSSLIYFDESDSEELSSLFWINILLGLILYLIFIAITPFFEYIFDTKLFNYLLILGFILVFSPPGLIFQSLLQKSLSFKNISLIEIISVIIASSLTIIMAFAGYGVWSLIFGQLVGAAIKSIFFTIIGVKKYDIKFRMSVQKSKKYLRFGIFQFGDKIFNFLSFKIDQVVIGSILGLEALGYYNFAFNLAFKPYNIINPIFTRVAYPLLSKVKEMNEKVESYYLRLVDIISFINSGIVFTLFSVLTILFEILWGDKWIQSLSITKYLLLVALFRSIFNPIGSLLLSRGKPDLSFKWNLGVFLITVPLLFLTALTKDINKVALSLLILYFTMFYPHYKILIYSVLGTKFKRYFFTIIPNIIIGLLVSLLIYIFNLMLIDVDKIITLSLNLMIAGIFLFVFKYLYSKEIFKSIMELIND